MFLCGSAFCFPQQELTYCDDYNGITGAVDATFERYYDSRTEKAEKISYGFPVNRQSINLQNSCAPKAGAFLMSFWDRFHPELIPNYEPGQQYLNTYYWAPSDSSTIPALASKLYGYMDTNNGHSGTSQADFTRGISRYVKENGNHTLSSSTLMKNGSIDREALKSAFVNNLPVVLFMNPNYNFIQLIEQNNTGETVYMTHFTGSHVVLSFGITHYTYKKGATSYQEDFLSVDMVDSDYAHGQMRLDDDYCDIVDAIVLQLE